MTFCSRFLEDVHTKLNHPERHETSAVNESPYGLSVFQTIDNSKKGCKVETIPSLELKQMRHYIITNYDEAAPWIEQVEITTGVCLMCLAINVFLIEYLCFDHMQFA
jgi:hypothetical protein